MVIVTETQAWGINQRKKSMKNINDRFTLKKCEYFMAESITSNGSLVGGSFLSQLVGGSDSWPLIGSLSGCCLVIGPLSGWGLVPVSETLARRAGDDRYCHRLVS